MFGFDTFILDGQVRYLINNVFFNDGFCAINIFYAQACAIEDSQSNN